MYITVYLQIQYVYIYISAVYIHNQYRHLPNKRCKKIPGLISSLKNTCKHVFSPIIAGLNSARITSAYGIWIATEIIPSSQLMKGTLWASSKTRLTFLPKKACCPLCSTSRCSWYSIIDWSNHEKNSAFGGIVLARMIGYDRNVQFSQKKHPAGNSSYDFPVPIIFLEKFSRNGLCAPDFSILQQVL